MIFDLYVTGEPQENGNKKRLGASLIARRLNQYKIPPSKGGDMWVVASVRDILMNPVYTGKIRWNWKPAVKSMVNGQVTVSRPRTKAEHWLVVDGLHEGIVDESVFKTAGEIMKSNSRSPVPDRHVVKNPLAGVVYCGICGRSMTRRPYSGKYPDTLMCPLPECSNVSAFLESVEMRVLEALEEWLGEYKLQWGLGSAAPRKNTKNKSHLDLKRKALDKISAELKTLGMQKSKLHDLLEQGIYDVNTFHSRTRELSGRIQQAESDLAAVDADIQLEEMREESRRTIIPKVEYLLDVYRTLPDAKSKNDLLKEIIEKVVYLKESGGRWHGSPDDFEITLYPRLPAVVRSH